MFKAQIFSFVHLVIMIFFEFRASDFEIIIE